MTAPADLPLLIAAPGLPGEPALVAELSRLGPGIRVARRCVDAIDLLSAAAAGLGSVALVGARLPRLGRETVTGLAAHGVIPLGVCLAGDDADSQRLGSLGIGSLVHPVGPEGAVADDLAALLREALPGPDSNDDDAPVGERHWSGQDGDDRGRVVAVWGPAGAPGCTSIAVGLADEVSRIGLDTMLVDADTHGGTVATLLGVVDEGSGLIVACRHADSGSLSREALARAARSVSPTLRILTGIPRARRWPEVRPAGLAAVLAACRDLCEATVVDLGCGVEGEAPAAGILGGPSRYAAAQVVLDDADLLVAVGHAEPAGIERLVAGLDDIRARIGDVPVSVAVTRVRAGALGRDAEGQVREALRRHAGIDDVVIVPDDRGAYDSCIRDGRTLAEAVPRSAARAAIRTLTRGILEVLSPQGQPELGR